jgi:hypothetical protein
MDKSLHKIKTLLSDSRVMASPAGLLIEAVHAVETLMGEIINLKLLNSAMTIVAHATGEASFLMVSF